MAVRNELDIKIVTLQEFLKLDPDYIRVLPEENKIIGNAEKCIRVEGKTLYSKVWFSVDIPISVHFKDRFDSKPKLVTIHLHGHDTGNLKTLLAHRPESLEIEYWFDNSCDLYREAKLKNETITLIGMRKKRRFVVQYSTIWSHWCHKMGRTAEPLVSGGYLHEHGEITKET